MRPQGLFELQAPRDLLNKLRHDLARLESDPLDQYAAFDFFVTAEHLVDWLYPSDRGQRTAERQSSLLLQVCSHLANGSKHFVATARHHKPVADTAFTPGPFSQEFSDAFDKSRLEVHLSGEAAEELGPVIQVGPLALLVLAFWEQHTAFGGNE